MKTINELNNKIDQIVSKNIKIIGRQVEYDLWKRYDRILENSNYIHEWERKE